MKGILHYENHGYLEWCNHSYYIAKCIQQYSINKLKLVVHWAILGEFSLVDFLQKASSSGENFLLCIYGINSSTN